ncbi:hypothetical protein CW710_01510 [Candidatus Bathyarchaeota archaeon]|nr:hypothetical protein [Candidatus Bathyarchaeota archaeon]RJS74477.1 MAG: hypothetical protein CW710_01510 [Candidatus Bathyarchaeota archaeon]
MPFTPFHLGPALLIGLLMFRLLDLPTFLVANVIVDIEPFLVLALGLPLPLHGFLHTYVGGSILAALLTLVMSSAREFLTGLTRVFRVEQKYSVKTIGLSSFSGIYLHILLDSFLYREMKPLYPLDVNPFLDALSSAQVYTLCSVSLAIGIMIYLAKLLEHRLKTNL